MVVKPYRFEEVLRHVGDGWRWHLAIFLVAGLPSFFAGFHNVGSVFLLYTPDHWCSLTNHQIQLAFNNNWTMTMIKDYSIPRKSETNDYSKCEINIRNYTAAFSEPPKVDVNGTVVIETYPVPEVIQVETCSSWIYDNSQMDSTVVTQFNLVCDDVAYASLGKSAYMIGMFFGSAIFGYLSDKYGRRKIGLLCLCQYMSSALLAVAAPYYLLYFVTRLLTGMAAIGTFMCTFVVMNETIMPKHRGVLQIIFNMFFSLGIIGLPGIAYFFREWKYFYLTLTISSLSMGSFYWILLESPRWLILQGRKVEAMKVLRKIAKIDGKSEKITDDQLMKMITKCYEYQVKSQMIDGPGDQSSVLNLIRTPEMRKNTFICSYLWAAVSCAYYGITFAMPNMGSNLRMMVVLIGLSDLCSALIGCLFVKLISRKANIFTNLLLTGLFCLVYAIISPTEDGWMENVVILIGRFTIGVAFCFLYVMTAELFPTDHRSVALGISSTMARFGAVSSAFMIDFLSSSYAMVAIGIEMLVACGLCLLVHETGNTTLPETETDVEHFDRLEIHDDLEIKKDKELMEVL